MSDTGGRHNQKARTRAALLDAAVELLREGASPSISEAAERALISVATAYRYFPSAEELWFEASESAVAFEPRLRAAREQIAAAGDDPFDRLDALIRAVGFTMLEDQAPFRRLARGALDQWFSEASSDGEDRTPNRQGRRNEQIAVALEPLRGKLGDRDLKRLAHALAVVVGTEAMISLTDAVGLDVDAAKEAMLDAARWMLRGALAELDA